MNQGKSYTVKMIVTENWMISIDSYKRYIEPEKYFGNGIGLQLDWNYGRGKEQRVD